MSPRKNDVSVEHFNWLVAGRSENQKVTLFLYDIIKKNDKKLNGDTVLQFTAQELAAVAFSLWRAVFLSDLTGEYKDILSDVTDFLSSLIADNTISYQTDKNARNWSFRYYVENARYRLNELSDVTDGIVLKSDLSKVTFTEKDEWLLYQSALTLAVRRFKDALRKA